MWIGSEGALRLAASRNNSDWRVSDRTLTEPFACLIVCVFLVDIEVEDGGEKTLEDEDGNEATQEEEEDDDDGNEAT
jgi:hypothetical protein